MRGDDVLFSTVLEAGHFSIECDVFFVVNLQNKENITGVFRRRLTSKKGLLSLFGIIFLLPLNQLFLLNGREAVEDRTDDEAVIEKLVERVENI